MDETTVKLIIGFAGALAGALAAAAANMYAANRKIKEIELAYIYKLQDGYLENARKLTGEVYVPINILLTNLSNAYDSFRARVDFESNTVPEGSYNFFVGHCRNYLSEIDDLFKRGADAYLTTTLDTYLRDFNSFIRESIGATNPLVKNIFEAGASLLPFKSGAQRFQLTSHSRAALPAPQFSIQFGGFEFGYSKEMLAAPFKSREFEKRFQTDVLALKSLIKEVTLGSHRRME
jgi:hypothetical protein